jgi:hypothetical protein
VWGIRRIAQGASNFLDRRIQPVFEIDEGVVFPQAFAQFVPPNDFSRSFEQRDKNLTRLFLQANPLSVAIQLAVDGVELERLESQPAMSGALIHRGRRWTASVGGR